MSMEDEIKNERLKEAFNHTLKELEIPNVFRSIEKSNFDELQKTHDSIHEFMLLAPLCSSKNKKDWHEKSAFFTYHHNAFHSAHRSLIEALSGYYNCAYTLLRNSFESIIQGAYYECLAHKRYRNNSKIPEVTKKGRKTLKGWINCKIREKPEREEKFEKISGAIFDELAPIFNKDKDINKRPYFPNYSEMVENLEIWNIFDPIIYPKNIWKEFYDRLSQEAHARPDQTEVGRRLRHVQHFEIKIIPNELNRFFDRLHEIMDIGIVIELNILSDWIEQNGDLKTRLKERMAIIDELGLKLSSEKLQSLVKA
ncbi:MAG: hypothetical protein MASP_00567 [Candidatus Methanolliviera sp. GoM_asphalt]|nr:MAG: hypothetical protein MASP_00567 [Candidatus Methanolliviera sp. GoM_asphalt]